MLFFRVERSLVLDRRHRKKSIKLLGIGYLD